MGWGVIESSGTVYAPGSVYLEDQKVPNVIIIGEDGLKRKQGVILQPQPDDNPNDPLMWSKTWKLAHLFVIAFGSSATNALTTMVIPGIEPLTEKFETTEAEISTFILTAPTFFTSVAAFFVVSGADIYGRRPFYVISTIVMALANFVAFVAQTYPVLIVARTITGIFSAAAFTLVTATIADIFFVHQRGSAVAFWNISLTVGGQVGQIVGGAVTDALGISAVFGLAAVVYMALSIPTYFIVLETGYFKRGAPVPRSGENEGFDEIEYAKHMPPPKQPYMTQLALFRSRMTNKAFWAGVVKPLFLLSSPIISYSAAMNSLFLILAGNATALLSVILSAPPYNLKPTEIGLTGLPILGVALIGGPLVGWISDESVRLMARTNGKNPGVAEPEFRLVLLLLAIPITAVGLVSLGNALQNGLPLTWVLTWLSVVSFGSSAGVQVAISYLIDYLPTQSGQAFSSVNMIAALVSFVGSAPMLNWLEQSGPQAVLSSLAGAGMAILAIALPFYVFGKRIRNWYGNTRLAQSILG
ncbi:major facilitator superfamily transporter [Colletotrichum incanum]|uniref:Major facilitator superfamily transporter n=1 Tax=Colletotrichum incanum TaxID=1573173 RepID=A0A161WAL0_COLIC|nr:major facilitator superfamily transporter [Colletotrichum incanum]